MFALTTHLTNPICTRFRLSQSAAANLNGYSQVYSTHVVIEKNKIRNALY
jgi:hypothetical protein